MSADLLLWLASVLGGLTFFAAGVLVGRGGRAARAGANARDEADDTQALAEDRLAAVLAEAEHLRAEVIRTETEARRVADDADRLRTEVSQRERALEAARAELARAREDTQAAAADRGRLTSALDHHRAAEQAAREALTRAEDHRGELDRAARKMRELESALEALRIERLRAQERQQELERNLGNIDPEAEKTLRHDLALAREQAQSQESKARRLEEANSALAQQVETHAHLSEQLAALERENAELRVRAMAGELSSPHEAGKPGNGGRGGRASIAEGGSFQALVDKLGDLDPVRSAVIADELGLVVASHGAHGEELAAIGALFARSGSEARKVLPLDHLQRVIVEDEHNISVTVRPLRAFEGSVAESELTLVTLAVGAEPDPRKVARILDGDHPAPAASS